MLNISLTIMSVMGAIIGAKTLESVKKYLLLEQKFGEELEEITRLKQILRRTEEDFDPFGFIWLYRRVSGTATAKRTQEREAAISKLTQICESSEWYTARYIAAVRLRTLKKDTALAWVNELEIELQEQDMDSEKRQFAKYDLEEWIRVASQYAGIMKYVLNLGDSSEINETVYNRLQILEKKEKKDKAGITEYGYSVVGNLIFRERAADFEGPPAISPSEQWRYWAPRMRHRSLYGD